MDKKKCIIFIHGFTGDPYRDFGLKELSYKEGFSFEMLSLKFHDKDISYLNSLTLTDTLADLKERIELVVSNNDEVYIIGDSFGGNLAVILSTFYNFKSIVLVSPFVFPKLKWRFYMKFFGPFLRRVKVSVKKQYPRGMISNDKFSEIPTKSIAEVFYSANIAKAYLKSLNIPTLIIQNEFDYLLVNSNAKKVFDLIKSNYKKLVLIEKSNQHSVLGKEANRILVLDWIKSISLDS